MSLVPIALLLALFGFWTSMLVRVSHELRRAGKQHAAMTLTFYTLGVAGVLILLGRRGKSPALAEWAKELTGAEPPPASDDFKLPEFDLDARDAAVEEVVAADKQAPTQAASPFQGEDIDLEGDIEVEAPVKTTEPEVLPANALEAAETILREAIRSQVTDIHLEPKPGQLLVRYRVDGILEPRWTYPSEMALTIISALKVKASMDVSEKRRAQDGSFSAAFHGRTVDFRVSTVATLYGEKMAIRVLDKVVALRKLEDLGLSKAIYQQLSGIVNSPHGMLVVCGATGSGKTTTLYAALQEVDRVSRNVITIENPIEYNLDGVNQHSVNEKAGITFAGLLRTALRQDPDILMVGEIRDKETAEIAMQSAMTGHFVYTTVHANDTTAAIFRLINLGAEPYMIATSLTGILGQTLVRRLCPACRIERAPTAQELQEFQSAGVNPRYVNMVYEGKGCGECRGTGYKGRIAAFELLLMNDEIRSLIQQFPSILQLKQAAEKAGMVHLRQDALQKAAAGMTSVAEALRVT